MTRPLAMRFISAFAVALSISAIYTCEAYAAPAYSSRPGAAYTIYLDFDGFNYSGNWVGGTPGTTAAYSSPEQIGEVWARISEKYAAFDINVTTVDPAVAAGHATSYADRQQYYDNTARMMHTVMGGNGAWTGSPGGISYVGTMQYNYPGSSNGAHTNWAFTDNLYNYPPYLMAAAVHEDGHGLGLSHQGDSNAEYSTNNNASGDGSYSPIMGAGYYSQRAAWSLGTVSNTTTLQNDVSVIMQNNGISMVNDGIGHSFAAATALPLTGTSIDATRANGIITPLASAGYNPIGVDNYTKDYFKFSVSTTGLVNLTLNNGGDWITDGVVAPGMTLRSKLNIFSAGNLLTPLFVGTENAATTAVTFSGTLAAGSYYAQITSFGGFQSSFDTQRKYFDMGSYVLTGSGAGLTSIVVPEPGTFGLLGLGIVGVIIRFRRRK